MDVEDYLQQFTIAPNEEKLSPNETNNTINDNELTNLESKDIYDSIEEQQPSVISPKLDEGNPSDDVACGGNELTDSVKADGVVSDDVACGGGELTDSVKADGVECEESGVADVACGGNSEVTDSVKGDGKECEESGFADVACGGNSELTDSVKVDGVADVSCGGGELKDSVKVDGKECGESVVADDVACGSSELKDSVKVNGEECEVKIIAESEPEGVKMDVTNDVEVVKGGEAVTEGLNDIEVAKGGEAVTEGLNDIEVVKGGEAVTEGQDDAVEGVVADDVADDVAKQNDEGDDMVTDRKVDVNEGVEAGIVADKEEGKMDVVEKQNEEVEAVKRLGRPRKREGSSPVKRRGRQKKRGRKSSKATPKSTSVKMSDNEEEEDEDEEDDEDDDEDFEAVETPSSIKRRGRKKKRGRKSSKATPKSTTVKSDNEEDVEAMETPPTIKRRGRPKKSVGNSAKATPKSTDLPKKKRGRPKKSEGNSAKAAPESTSVKMIEKNEDVEAVETESRDSTFKKLGRPRKSEGDSQKATPKSASAKEKEEEDVCFICFDGGELVLCDRRDCPKAYHHSCVDRDEAFFQTKGQWNCGWHLCSVCAKKAKYMCYTCTFSLCKACARTNVIFCVREEEKKGFCEPCMKIVMLLENEAQEPQEGVDFDDKDSWEYMFKEYWTDMKPKLNISLAELLEAKNAWKGSSPAGEQEPPAVHSDGGSGSENPSENPESETKKKRRRKSKEQKTIDSAVIASEGTPVPESENTEWATEELLEFVAHMGNNNKSYQSQFNVQALLLEYIKTNKLRDPRKKSQIICDARLTRLFGKPRVGHFEMLKLLESHFLIKEDSQIDKSVVDTEVGLVDDDEDYETAKRDRKDKKRKIRKKADREPQSNREDFAAIDVHNINLIYLKRKFLEDLLDDTETLNSKVVGTFVRIRIQGANNKQDIYRLVQVTGTTKGEHYAVGKKMTDTMLEILKEHPTVKYLFVI